MNVLQIYRFKLNPLRMVLILCQRFIKWMNHLINVWLEWDSVGIIITLLKIQIIKSNELLAGIVEYIQGNFWAKRDFQR